MALKRTEDGKVVIDTTDEHFKLLVSTFFNSEALSCLEENQWADFFAGLNTGLSIVMATFGLSSEDIKPWRDPFAMLKNLTHTLSAYYMGRNYRNVQARLPVIRLINDIVRGPAVKRLEEEAQKIATPYFMDPDPKKGVDG